MDVILTIMILDTEILKVQNSMNEILEKNPSKLDTLNKLELVRNDLKHVKRHLKNLIKKYEKRITFVPTQPITKSS
jgi:hypothetical protein